jgi:hypothetical protein
MQAATKNRLVVLEEHEVRRLVQEAVAEAVAAVTELHAAEARELRRSLFVQKGLLSASEAGRVLHHGLGRDRDGVRPPEGAAVLPAGEGATVPAGGAAGVGGGVPRRGGEAVRPGRVDVQRGPFRRIVGAPRGRALVAPEHRLLLRGREAAPRLRVERVVAADELL